ncbi:hypothetical protein [Cecembia rubra]|nr:hypothetical protein [Cecembia rubra]
MAVNNSLKSKKIQIQDFQFKMIEGLKEFDDSLKSNEAIKPDYISEIYQRVKKNLQEDDFEAFENKVRRPYQQIKLLKSQFNKLISKKPYSFVATLMGHKPY